MDIKTFTQRYDNGAGFWNVAGDDKIAEKEIRQGGGMQQMATDYQTLNDADKDRAWQMIEPKRDFKDTLGRLSLKRLGEKSKALEAQLPTSGPVVDPIVEQAAHAGWSARVAAAVKTAKAEWGLQIVPFTIELAPYFQSKNGTIEHEAGKLSFRRFLDTAKLAHPDVALYVTALNPTGILMHVAIDNGYPPPPSWPVL